MRFCFVNEVSYKTKNWGGEFQGSKNDMVPFQFQRPPGEFEEEYGMPSKVGIRVP